MKKVFAILFLLLTVLSTLVGCTGKSYIGDYYSKEARAMNAEAILSIYDENNEQVFEIEYLYEDGRSALIHGTYEEESETKLIFHPETQFIVINDVPAQTEIEDKTPIEAIITGDTISLGDGATYIKKGSKTAETDTTMAVTTTPAK